jgi:two-component system, OmpR family, alkaline phosphatase synthesis response regulator PhoP
MSGATRVLVVEDEEAIAAGLVLNMEAKGYTVSLARDGAEALRRATSEPWDLILLDVRLPEIDGFTVCQRLRASGDTTPILILTARSQPDDRVYGLKIGADDYLVKPFDLAELMARVEGMLRRQAWSRREPAGETPAAGRVRFGESWIDFDSYEAQTRHGRVQLSQKELEVMRVFLARPNRVVTRRELLAEVWQLPDHPNARVVDNVIVALRQAFEQDSSRPRHILSVRGVGYRFVP